MKQSTLWTVIIILLILIGLIYVFADASKGTMATTTPATSTVATSTTAFHNTVNYYCQGNSTITANYTQSQVALTLSDGRMMTLPQIMSGSGIQYEKNNILFASEGNDAYLSESGKMTYNDCTAGTVANSSNGMSTFTDGSKTFSFTYPNSFSVSGGDLGYTQAWRQEATTS